MKKSPATSQSNTLLNYFSRTPTSQSSPKTASVANDDKTPLKTINSLTPKSSTPLFGNGSTPKSQTKVHNFKSPKTPISSKNGTYQLFDLVWAKLDGYPWWPSIICNDPSSDTFDSKGRIHVQFFDDPVSHAWVNKRDIKPYTGSVQPGMPVKIRDVKLKFAVNAAEDALNIDREQRCKLIGNLTLDDYENSESMSVSESDQSEINESNKNDRVNVNKNLNKQTPMKRKKSPQVVQIDSSNNDSDESEEVKSQVKRKRFKRVSVVHSSESEDDYKPDAKEEDETFSDDSISEAESDALETPPEDDDDDEVLPEAKKFSTPARKKNSKTVHNKSCNKSINNSSFLNTSKNTPSKADTSVSQTAAAAEACDREWPHLSYSFLLPQNIADTNGRKMLLKDGEFNPEYDSSTLHLPSEFLQQQTPAMRQWWQFKSTNFDTILFFKMGKFYELFHMDAVIGAKELQILFMRGEHAHAGFPEKSYKRYADALIQKGYKVARIEQTETPAMMEQRVKCMRKPTKFDKVVRREICRISSLGTRYMSDIDSDVFLDSNSYLIAFSCQQSDNYGYEFGLCFIDVSIGKFHLSQFTDDRHYSKLRTLIAHYSPAEIICERSNKVVKLLETICPSIPKQQFRKFWPATKTLKYLSEKKIWSKTSENFRQTILDCSDILNQTCLPSFELALGSMGAIIEYLEKALISEDIISMGQFEVYLPPEANTCSSILPRNLILDSLSMKNLELLQSFKGEQSNTLFKIINNCCTPFGKRLLHHWLCQPLCNQREVLETRQQAVRDLSDNNQLLPEIKSWCAIMKKIPDLERLLTQIHTQSSMKRTKDHPDSRAIMFESEIYRRRRINNFLNTLEGFERIVSLMEKISENIHGIQSQYLMRLVREDFPDLSDKIRFFRNSFNAERARKEGNIIPGKGVDVEYDEALDKIEEAQINLDAYLKQQTAFFRTRVQYVNAGKNRYQLEVPDSCVMKAVNSTEEKYELKSARKGFKRYHTPTVLKLVSLLEQAETKRETVLGDILRRLLERFDTDYQQWKQAISCVAQLDALISLSKTRQIFETDGHGSCLPSFVWDNDQNGPRLSAQGLRNACLIGGTRELISNNVELNGQTLVLTGPNMAGKTTLMRSVGLLVVLAQIGAYVPASECTLSPVDRIFTRIGAYDHVIESQSTFMIELNETVTIVNYATVNSLVLIDELGRGTSTFDGIAIASAVLENLATKICCRTMFSTHFHSIVEEIMNTIPTVSVGHMSYLVENENKDDPTEEDIVFLYKLQEGICNKSYGYNVAKMAGIPRDVLRNAYQYGQEFQTEMEVSGLLETYVQCHKRGEEMEKNKQKFLSKYLLEMIVNEYQ